MPPSASAPSASGSACARSWWRRHEGSAAVVAKLPQDEGRAIDVTDLGATRWRQADDLLAAALEQPPEQRAAFVRAASTDPAAVDLVLSLLSAEGSTPDFLDRGAMDQALA